MNLDCEFSVLQEMMQNFIEWFPFDGSEDEEEREMYRDGFARCKLNLELGEYTADDLDYLRYIEGVVIDNDEYFNVICQFIYALSQEYGW